MKKEKRVIILERDEHTIGVLLDALLLASGSSLIQERLFAAPAYSENRCRRR